MTAIARVEAEDLPTARLVRVIGEIDLSNVREVTDAMSAAVPHEAALVIADLSGTTYLDSAGVAMLFRLAERLRYRRQELRLVVPADAPIRAMLELTQLHHLLPVRDSVAEATSA